MTLATDTTRRYHENYHPLKKHEPDPGATLAAGASSQVNLFPHDSRRE